MSWLSEWLKRAGILPRFTRDDELNAETEDALRTQKAAVQDVKEQLDLQHDKSERLRGVLREARLRVNTFAQFEQRIKDMSSKRSTRH
jgi:hypothetical protein